MDNNCFYNMKERSCKLRSEGGFNESRGANNICISSSYAKPAISYKTNRDLFKSIPLSKPINYKSMRYSVLIIMLLTYMNLFGQLCDHNNMPKDILNQLDKMGVDGVLLLNNHESAFLNVIFKDSLDGFDFTNKKVGFIKISGDRGKANYFEMQKKYFADKSQSCDNGTLYILNATQKKESGGYDAAIVYWSKFLLPVDKVVKKLKK